MNSVDLYSHNIEWCNIIQDISFPEVRIYLIYMYMTQDTMAPGLKGTHNARFVYMMCTISALSDS